jgi:hypothetical protein
VNNCTACGNICLPPPANGHAICQGSSGCGVQCDSGHLKCGNTCCDTPPANANAFATCSASSACGVQCNPGNHACNATSSPCYDDTDVTHCGPSCTDCRQPNATAVCTGAQCANICTGTTLSCPGTAGHVVCGTWDFESGTTEGWTNTSGDIGVDVSGGQFQATSIRGFQGTHSLAIGHNDTASVGGGFSTFTIHLCPSGVPISLSNKSVNLHLYLAPTTGGDLNAQLNLEFYLALYNGQNLVRDVDLNGSYTGTIMPFPANQWLSVSSGPLTDSAVTDIEIVFRTYNDPWVGTLFFDDIMVQ